MREYFPKGVNGALSVNGEGLCHTIELPWRDNQHAISCIPEGRYELAKRFSPKLRWHLLVKDVPERDLILIHPYNDAEKEAQGCIAPVTTITGEGKGDNSRIVFEKLKAFVFPVLERGEKVVLVIRQKSKVESHKWKKISRE